MGRYSGVRYDFCKNAADALSAAFVFSGSPEGGSFWTAIYGRLNDLSYAGRNAKSVELPPIDTSSGMLPLLQEENRRLSELVNLRDAAIDAQAQQIVDLERRLRVADFCNLPGARSGGFR